MNRYNEDTPYNYNNETIFNLQKPPTKQKKAKKKKATWKKVLLVVGLTFLGIVIGSGVGLAYYLDLLPSFVDKGSEQNLAADSGSEELSKRVTFLLIGVDERPDSGGGFNTDSIILASADPDTKIISLMSIPRDTEVLGHSKINSVAANYGIDKLVQVVGDITGVKIDGYVKTNFNGFKEIIDTLGGIDIYVESKMYKETGDEEDGYIDLEKGPQRLNGSQALQYARFRDYFYGDISRTTRQQKVIMAIAREALKSETIGKLPQLLPQAMKAVQTDLKLADLLRLAGMAKSFKSENMVSATLPGIFLTGADNLSYWRVDEATAKKVAADLLKGISTNKMVLGGYSEVKPETEDKTEQSGTGSKTNPGKDPVTPPEKDPVTPPEKDPVTPPEKDPVTPPETPPVTDPEKKSSAKQNVNINIE